MEGIPVVLEGEILEDQEAPVDLVAEVPIGEISIVQEEKIQADLIPEVPVDLVGEIPIE